MPLIQIDHDAEFAKCPASDDMDWPEGTAGDLIGKGFQAYLKILHPMYKDLDIEDTGMTWKEDEKRRKGVIQSWLKKVSKDPFDSSTLSRVSVGDEPENAERLRWAQLAADLGIEIEPGVYWRTFDKVFETRWPRFILAASEDALPESQAAIVFDAIRSAGLGAQVRYRFGLLDAIHMTNEEVDGLLYQGTAEDWQEVWRDISEGSGPTHTYDESHRWCLSTPHDFDFSVLGGPVSLIEAVERHPEIEGLRVARTDRMFSVID